MNVTSAYNPVYSCGIDWHTVKIHDYLHSHGNLHSTELEHNIYKQYIWVKWNKTDMWELYNVYVIYVTNVFIGLLTTNKQTNSVEQNSPWEAHSCPPVKKYPTLM